jgi:hypothetical protein
MLTRALVAVLGVAVATQLWAFPEAARQTKSACVTCHTNPAGGAGLSTAGTAFKADGKAPAASTAKAAEYVGAAKCKTCHMKQHKAWLETPHARAWAGMVNADPKKNAEMATALKVEIKESAAKTDGCVSCHVTGFHLAGGYPQADTTRAAALVNVTCEACHGPGSLHLTAPMAEKKKFIAKAGEAMCKQCHTAVTTPTFTFAEFSKRGVHAVPATAK